MSASPKKVRRRRPRRLGRTSWLIRKLGVAPNAPAPERRGFIGIQIDGLGYYVLRGALTRRYAPFLRGLVKRRGYQLHRYRVGLPATTPASQLGIFYGDNDDVPGFRWYDKQSRTLHVTKSSNVCATLEAEVRERSRGILRDGGSSYCNMFSGDADTSTLTLSTLGQPSRTRLGWRDLLIFTLFFTTVFLRIFFLSMWETMLELYDQLVDLRDGRAHRDEGIFPLVRVITNVVFREIATQGCLLDIYRGVPYVYLNFSGYDEVAHHRGPNSVYAKLVLRSIDRQIRRIYAAARRYAAREYDIVLLSDHGQSTTVPWLHLHGQTPTEFILEKLAHTRLGPLGADYRSKHVGRALALTAWLRELRWILPRSLGGPLDVVAGWMQERLPDEAAVIDWSQEASVVFAPTGSLAHLYFTETTDPLTIEALRGLHGPLVDALIGHPSIGLVAARAEHGAIEIHSRRGSLRVEAGGTRTRIGEDPLTSVLDGDDTVREIRRLLAMRLAGDLVLFTARDKNGRVVNFQVEMGSHGGLHIDEQAAFVMAPHNLAFDFGKVRSVRDLYRFFESYHHVEETPNTAAA